MESDTGVLVSPLKFHMERTVQTIITTQVRVVEHGSFRALEEPIDHDPPVSLDRYLSPTRHIESDDPALVSVARSITGTCSSSNTVESVRRICEYVVENLHYPVDGHGQPIGNPAPMGARYALNCIERYRSNSPGPRGCSEAINKCFSGCDCTEFACLFVALCRAAGFPARVVNGKVNYGEGWLSHDWAQVWLDSGWLPVDLNYSKSTGRDTLGTIAASYVGIHSGLVSSRLKYEYRTHRPSFVTSSTTNIFNSTIRREGGGI